MPIRLQADFNGLFGDVLCLSHRETCLADDGTQIAVIEGMAAVAFEPDANALGEADELYATGVIEKAPESLACNGSRWILRIDSDGVRNRLDDLGAGS